MNFSIVLIGAIALGWFIGDILIAKSDAVREAERLRIMSEVGRCPGVLIVRYTSTGDPQFYCANLGSMP